MVHASVDDPFLPMQLATLRAGVKAGKVTVLIGFDMDVWDLLPAQLAQMGRVKGLLHIARTIGMDFWMRRMLPRVSVAMLKEGLVHDRYSRLARNPKQFCHSMFSESDMISKEALSERLASMRSGRPLRLAYFGRFVERKGLADGIRILAVARARGLEATYHLIGEGPQQADLERLAAELGVLGMSCFEGQFPYGPSLHERLRSFDALLFPPTEEDTPRMVYDAYAAGMPLITSDIAFLRRRAQSDGASRLFPIGGIEAAADILLELSAERDQLAALSEAAHEAATGTPSSTGTESDSNGRSRQQSGSDPPRPWIAHRPIDPPGVAMPNSNRLHREPVSIGASLPLDGTRAPRVQPILRRIMFHGDPMSPTMPSPSQRVDKAAGHRRWMDR